ncbi:MAG TPA: dihydrolipoamide acetyltransferase family protein [Tissierellaceae bacterium]|nr:dihydrolipoamide acetyltransferase family protein [Tissierellaceae bacterium]
MEFEFKFPDVGEGIHEGTIVEWLVEKGQEIEEGDSIAEVETDKVTTEIPSPETGKVLELKGDKGDIIHVGDTFVILDIGGARQVEEREVGKEDKEQKLEGKEKEVEEETAGVVGKVEASSEMIESSTEGREEKPKEKTRKQKVLATPVARALARDLNIDINTVVGTGPNGRVMKEDIRKVKEKESEPAVEEKIAERSEVNPLVLEDEEGHEELYERIPITRIRKTIAEKMSESKFTIPHTVAMDEINITKLDEFRRRYKDQLKEEGVSLTYLPFIIKASISALKQLPEFNSSLDEVNDELVLKHFYNIGIATDTERGLLVPVIKSADKKSIVELAKDIVEVSTEARDNELDLEDLRGGTFTVTNYGSIGGQFAVPIINYPEAAILGVGRTVEKPIVRDGEIIIAKMLPLSLSYDHRIIDGSSGARFLNILKELLMDPEMLFLKS